MLQAYEALRTQLQKARIQRTSGTRRVARRLSTEVGRSAEDDGAVSAVRRSAKRARLLSSVAPIETASSAVGFSPCSQTKTAVEDRAQQACDIAAQLRQQRDLDIMEPSNSTSKSVYVRKFVYASRTHTQLAQFLQVRCVAPFVYL